MNILKESKNRMLFCLAILLIVTLTITLCIIVSSSAEIAYADGHEHNNFEYTINGNVLTATCKETGCSFSETLTLTAEGGTYSGTAYGATLNSTEFTASTGITIDSVAIQYAGTSYNSDPYDSATAPTNAGEYTATATVTIGTDDYVFVIFRVFR